MAFNTSEIYLFGPAVPTEEITNTMDNFLKEWIQYHSYSDNKILYHYTTLNGLKGILEERAIWLSHVSQLNDPLEIQYGKKIIADIINERIQNEDNAEIRKFYHTLLVYINAFGGQLHHVFVFCFCENADLLSQWREYSEKDGGYNLGFELSFDTKISLHANELKNAKTPLLRKVIYDKKEQVDIVNKYITMISESVSKVISEGKVPQSLGDMKHFASVMAMQAINVLLDMLLTFKHPAFNVEKEWRLLYVTTDSFQPENLRFRDNLIPYHIFNLYNSLNDGSIIFPIKSINYGPMHDPQKTSSSLNLYLQHVTKNGSLIKINPSSVSIRGTDYQINI